MRVALRNCGWMSLRDFRHHWLCRALETRFPVELVGLDVEHDVEFQFMATTGPQGRPLLSDPVPGDPLRVSTTCESLHPDLSRSHAAVTFSREENEKLYRLPNYVHIHHPAEMQAPYRWRAQWSERPPQVTMMARNIAPGSPRMEFAKFLETKDALICAGPAFHKFESWIGNPPNSMVAKLGFLRRAPFHAAFENREMLGYVTEKLPTAFAAGVVPIYWGTSDVVHDFNHEWFIRARDFGSYEELWKRVEDVWRRQDITRPGELFSHSYQRKVWSMRRFAVWVGAALKRHRL